jgi:hypothetical protein
MDLITSVKTDPICEKSSTPNTSNRVTIHTLYIIAQKSLKNCLIFLKVGINKLWIFFKTQRVLLDQFIEVCGNTQPLF